MFKFNLNKKKLIISILVLIILIGIFLRFYQLDKIPPGPEQDEASVGYNAFSILSIGKDEWGNKYPLIFPAFGDYKNPLYIYLTSFAIKIFGFNLFAIRFFAVLFGSLNILIWFSITFLLFNNKLMALLTSLFIAFSPFGIFFSRTAGDGMILSSILIGLGILMEIISIKKNKLIYFNLAIIFLIFSMFSYNLGRVIAPILILIFFIKNFIAAKKKLLFVFPVVLCLITLIILYNQSKIGAFSRIKYVGIFGDKKGVTLEINEFREHDKNNTISKILHNKPTFFITTLLSNYISHFSTDFLGSFKEQSVVYESFYPPLYLVLLPFYYLGLIIFAKSVFEKKTISKKKIIILFLIIIAPLPSIITEGSPSGKRYLAAHGLIEMITAYGIYSAYLRISQIRYKRTFILLVTTIFFVSVGFFLNFFFVNYPKKYSHMYAEKERHISNMIKAEYNNYDYIIISKQFTGFPYIFPLNYLQYSPKKFIENKTYYEKDGWFYINSFDKFLFPDEITTDYLAKYKTSNHKILFVFNKDEINKFESYLQNTSNIKVINGDN